METIKLMTHVGASGVLKLELPIGVGNVNCNVVVVYTVQPTQEQKDWSAFVNETFGSLVNDPLVRPAQLSMEIRDAIE